MASEQRIIGGGLLLVGVLIVLVLLYLFGGDRMSAREAYDRLAGEIWPAWKKAEQEHDYDDLERYGEQAHDVIEQAGRAAVAKYILGQSTTDRDLRRLKELVESGAFARNADGEFELGGRWYGERAHGALVKLNRAVDERLKTVRELRRIATAARKAVDDAREGARVPLAYPEPHGSADAATLPGGDADPIAVHDRQLYAVFGLDAEKLGAALASESPGGGARPARLRWNRDVAGGDLSSELSSVPALTEELVRLAADIEVQSGRVREELPDGDELDALMQRAAVALGDGLTGKPRERYFADRTPYEDPAVVERVLRWEASVLESYAPSLQRLAPKFALRFELD